jgi:sulfate adenylyltransferase
MPAVFQVRQLLSSELGFSDVHRNLNVKRIGFVASEVVKPGGVVIACPIGKTRPLVM